MKNLEKKRFSKNLTYLLELNNISKAEFSKIIGISPSSVQYWTEGRTLPREDTRKEIAFLFNLHGQDLFSYNIAEVIEFKKSRFDEFAGSLTFVMGSKIEENRKKFLNSIPLSYFNTNKTQYSFFIEDLDDGMNALFEVGTILYLEPVSLKEVKKYDLVHIKLNSGMTMIRQVQILDFEKKEFIFKALSKNMLYGTFTFSKDLNNLDEFEVIGKVVFYLVHIG